MRGGFVHRVRFVVTGKTPLKDKIMITLSSAQRCKEAEKSCGHVVPIFTAVSETISITCGVMWNEVGCIPRVLNSCFVLKTSGTQWKVFFLPLMCCLHLATVVSSNLCLWLCQFWWTCGTKVLTLSSSVLTIRESQTSYLQGVSVALSTAAKTSTYCLIFLAWEKHAGFHPLAQD